MSSSVEVAEEIESIASIYGEDFKALPGVWGRKCFSLHLGPTKTVLVKFTLPTNYPSNAPEINIKSLVLDKTQAPHLSDNDMEILKLSCRDIINDSVGSVMLFDVAAHIESFVNENERMPKSLHERMLERQSSEEQSAMEARKLIRIPSDGDVRGPRSPSGVASSGNGNANGGDADGDDSSQGVSVGPTMRRINSATWAEVVATPCERPLNDRSASGTHIPAVPAAGGGSHARAALFKNWRAASGDDYSSGSSDNYSDEDETEDLHSRNDTGGPRGRYQEDFVELGQLGKGAQGTVFRVRNKLDRRTYAIKKVAIEDRFRNQILREVTTISKLSHKYIVRYYASWIEDVHGTVKAIDKGKQKKKKSLSSAVNSVSLGRTLAPSSSLEEGGLGMNAPVWVSDDSNILFDSAPSSCESSSSEDYSSDDDSDDDSDSGSNSESGIANGRQEKKTLYLQMEYCEGTLIELIEKGALHQDEARMLSLFRQILEALAYCHDKKVIHRDLKPGNIFYNDSVRIGDFGLAKEGNINTGGRELTETDATGMSRSQLEETSADDENLTKGVGTRMYCAPEVDTRPVEAVPGSLRVPQYDLKADMYSIGVVLFEMSHPPFMTRQERFTVIKNLREKAVFPKDYVASELLKHAILWLTKHNAAERPSAAEMLSSSLFPLAPLDIKEVSEFLKQDTEATTHLVRGLLSSEIQSASRHDPRRQYDRDYDRDLVQYIAKMGKPRLEDTSSRRKSDGTGVTFPRFNVPLNVRENLCSIFQTVFHSRGAVNLIAPLLQLQLGAPGYGSVNLAEERLRFFDCSGKVVTLQSNLLINYARLVARSGVNCMRRYQIGPVYKLGSTMDQHPMQKLEAVYDVIIPIDHNNQKVLVQQVCEVEYDVLGTCLDILSRLKLHETARVRLCDDRLAHSIIEVCVWNVPLIEGMTLEQVKELCMAVLSGNVDSFDDLPEGVRVRLAPYHNILSPEQRGGDQQAHNYEDMLNVLHKIETIFFNDVIAQNTPAVAVVGNGTSKPGITLPLEPAVKKKESMDIAMMKIGQYARGSRKKVLPTSSTSPASPPLAPAVGRGVISTEANGIVDTSNKKEKEVKTKKHGKAVRAFDAAILQLRAMLAQLVSAQRGNRSPYIHIELVPVLRNSGLFDKDALRFICEVETGGSHGNVIRRKILEGGHFEKLVASLAEQESKQNMGRVCMGLRVYADFLCSEIMREPGGNSQMHPCNAGYDVVVGVTSVVGAKGASRTEDITNLIAEADSFLVNSTLAQLRRLGMRAISSMSFIAGSVISGAGTEVGISRLVDLCGQYNVSTLVTVSSHDPEIVYVYRPMYGLNSTMVYAEQLSSYLIGAIDRFKHVRISGSTEESKLLEGRVRIDFKREKEMAAFHDAPGNSLQKTRGNAHSVINSLQTKTAKNSSAEAVMKVLSTTTLLGKDKGYGGTGSKNKQTPKAKFEDRVSDFLFSLLGIRYSLVNHHSSTTTGPVVLASEAGRSLLQHFSTFIEGQGVDFASTEQGVAIDSFFSKHPELAVDPGRRNLKLVMNEVKSMRGSTVVLYSIPDDSYVILRLV